MNIPEIYLVEPYNAYTNQKGARKKHWHEIIEEQALLQRIMAEQQALLEASSKTLPPNSPDTSNPAVGNMAAGAGGVLPSQVFNPTTAIVNFDRTPSSGAGPLTVQFSNLTSNPELYTYLWTFGDGTTSAELHPTHVYQSGSSATGIYTASLQATSSVTGVPAGKSPNVYTSASKPTVTPSFTFITSSNVAPFTAAFTNTTVNTSQTPTTTYLWTFTNGTVRTATTTNAIVTVDSGSFTASLQATGSYNIAGKYTQSFFATLPTVTSLFTIITSSRTAPATTSFTNITAYTGSGTLTYRWEFDSGSLTSSVASPSPVIYINSGPYTASLQVTESTYNIASRYTQSWRLA